jgi:RimJ/RimL family protein N-acetyltransferase
MSVPPPADPGLETARLRLRRFTLDDAAFAHELVNDAAWLRFIGDRGVRTLDDARVYIGKTLAHYAQHGFGAYVVELRATGEAIGNCGLFKREGLPGVDIGFAFLERFRGQGYAGEAAAAVLTLGRERFGLKRIEAYTVPYNTRSIRLLEKLGLKYEATIRMPNDTEDVSRLAVEFGPGG